MVCIEIFDWKYFRNIRHMPPTHTFIMLITVAIVVVTHDLAKGVIAGVLLSVIVYAYRSSTQLHIHEIIEGKEKVYHVRGQLFFVSSDTLLNRIDFNDESSYICIDLTMAHVWDHTAQQTLDKIIVRLQDKGKHVRVLNQSPHPRSKSA
jgi:SulP family sulfate permease